jgi:hypothetical protein
MHGATIKTFRKKSNIKFHEKQSKEGLIVPKDRQTDRRTSVQTDIQINTTRQIIIFSKFANKLKKALN